MRRLIHTWKNTLATLGLILKQILGPPANAKRPQRGNLQFEPLDVPNVVFCSCITLFMLQGIWRWWKEDRIYASPVLITLLVFPLPYYLTHSSMDYRQPIEPQIVILVTIGLFGFKDWTASTDSQEVEDFRQC